MPIDVMLGASWVARKAHESIKGIKVRKHASQHARVHGLLDGGALSQTLRRRGLAWSCTCCVMLILQPCTKPSHTTLLHHADWGGPWHGHGGSQNLTDGCCPHPVSGSAWFTGHAFIAKLMGLKGLYLPMYLPSRYAQPTLLALLHAAHVPLPSSLLLPFTKIIEPAPSPQPLHGAARRCTTRMARRARAACAAMYGPAAWSSTPSSRATTSWSSCELAVVTPDPPACLSAAHDRPVVRLQAHTAWGATGRCAWLCACLPFDPRPHACSCLCAESTTMASQATWTALAWR